MQLLFLVKSSVVDADGTCESTDVKPRHKDLNPREATSSRG